MTYPRRIPHWIDDEEVWPDDDRHFCKHSPRDDASMAIVARGGKPEVCRALAAADAAARQWGALPVPARGAVIGELGVMLRARQEEVAHIIAAETGKPLKYAAAEAVASCDLAMFMQGEGSRFYGRTTTSPVPHRSVRTIRQPIGICAAITPFNSPLAGIAWKVFPALLCGNAVVAKSHELTPYTAVWLARLFKAAGLPAGLLSVIQGFGDEVGAPLVTDDRVGVVSFTGSAATGKAIQRAVSGRAVLGKVCLELGGKNPLVVCDDADLDRAAEHAAASAFIDAGQRCAAGSRIIVFDRVYDAFRRRLLEKASALKVGADDGDDLGPVISERQLERLLRTIAEVVNRGASIALGGHRLTGARHAAGYYLAPTILEHVAPTDAVSQEELFGPVTCLYRVGSLDEAIALANGTAFGLTGAIHTINANRIEEFVNRYRAGLVSVNGPTYGSGPHMPFGGLKNSGNGFREPGTEALDVYSELKTVVVNHDPQNV